MKRTVCGVVAAFLIPRAAFACPVCFGASDGPMLQGSNMGILALLVVTVTMLGAFAAFFVSLARRASRSESEALCRAPFSASPEPVEGNGQ